MEFVTNDRVTKVKQKYTKEKRQSLMKLMSLNMFTV
jgi:hypothetical protein